MTICSEINTKTVCTARQRAVVLCYSTDRLIFGLKSPADSLITASGVITSGTDLYAVCGTFMGIMIVDAVFYIAVYTVFLFIQSYHSFSLAVIVFAQTHHILQEVFVMKHTFFIKLNCFDRLEVFDEAVCNSRSSPWIWR